MSFREKIRLSRIVLRHLEAGPKRWTPLLKLTIEDSGTVSKFRTILHDLLDEGFITQREEGGAYTITEKGRRFLNGVTD